MYLLIDRSATSIRSSQQVRHLTLLRRSSQPPLSHLQLTLTDPSELDKALPASFTTFHALDLGAESSILSLSPPSEHLLTFRLPSGSVVVVPGVGNGSKEWWAQQQGLRGGKALRDFERVMRLARGVQ